jgi:hypothetical protein
MIENKEQSSKAGEIPEDFQKWARANADENYYCGSDLPDSVIYQAATANEAYFEGTIDAYHHLSPQLEHVEKMYMLALDKLNQPSYPRLKEGDKVVLDKDLNNASVVILIRMTKHYSIVGDGESKWNTMTNRLSPIGQHIEEPNPTHTAQ